MPSKQGYKLFVVGTLLISLCGAGSAQAEVDKVTVTYQYGLSYLPLMVMEAKHMVEDQAKSRGIKDLSTHFARLGGAGLINDSLLSGSAQFGAVGVPSLVTLWEKTKTNLKVKTVGSLCYMPMYLNSSDPKIKTLADYDGKQKIALPTTKISVQAVTLQMAAAQQFGKNNYEKLDPFTVSMTHPDGMSAMMAGKDVVTSHFTSPPFQYLELKDKKVHKVLDSYTILGGPSTFVLVVSTDTFRKKNPKVFESFVAAFREAQEFIRKNKNEAAQIYLTISQSKENLADVVALLNNKDIEFTMTPKNLMKYAQFMQDVKSIQAAPSSWKDLTFDHLHTDSGS